MRAISHANKILGWYENLSDDEIPPEWMWPFDDELLIWFERVKKDRLDKFGGPSDDTEPEGPVMQNELAESRR